VAVDLGQVAHALPERERTTGGVDPQDRAAASIRLDQAQATNGLDPRGRELMLELVRDLRASGMSIIYSSHLLADVERTSVRRKTTLTTNWRCPIAGV
jgi:hypothetical protein